MSPKRFHMEPAKLIDGDPFGLHEPITMGDLKRIEAALADGTVAGSEAERLRKILNDENEKFRAWLQPVQERLANSFKVDIDALIGPIADSYKASQSALGSIADNYKASDALIGPIADSQKVSNALCSMFDTQKVSNAAVASIGDKFKVDFDAIAGPIVDSYKASQSALASMSESYKVSDALIGRTADNFKVDFGEAGLGPRFGADLGPAYATLGLDSLRTPTLDEVCHAVESMADKVATAIAETELRAEARADERHTELLASGRRQLWVIVAVTIALGMLSIVASLLAPHFGQPVDAMWDYDTFYWADTTGWSGQRGKPGIDAMLSSKGEQGWELVTVTSDSDGLLFIFKRPGPSSDG